MTKASGAARTPRRLMAAGRARCAAVPTLMPVHTRNDQETFWAVSARRGLGEPALNLLNRTRDTMSTSSTAMPSTTLKHATLSSTLGRSLLGAEVMRRVSEVGCRHAV